MKLFSSLLASWLVSITMASIGYAAPGLTTSGLTEWKATHSDIGCGLNYYVRDQLHEIRADYLNVWLSFAFYVSNELDSLSPVGPLPKRETVIIITMEAPNASLKIMAEGKAINANRVGKRNGRTVFYYDPAKTKAISKVLDKGNPISIEYSYDDDLEHTRSIGLTSFRVAHKMFKACADNI